MLKRILFVARNDLKFMLRARETLLWVFLMPIVFFFFIGDVTGGFARPRGERKDPIVMETGPAAGFLADEIRRRLEEQDYAVTVEAAGADTTSTTMAATTSRRIRVPAAFTDSILAGVRTPVTFVHAAEGIGADYEDFRVGRAVFAVLADLVAIGSAEGRATPESFAALAAMPRTVSIESQPAGKRRHVPSGFEQAIPGIVVMFSLLVMVTSGSVLLVIEREAGLLRRLASAPLSRGEVVAGKWLGKLALGLVQLAFGMIAGTLLFKMDWGASLPAVFGTLVVWGAFTSALGLLLGCIARTHGQAIAAGVIGANVLAPLGGCWWPIEIAPAWMQKLAMFLPTGWAMDAMHRLVSFQAGPASVTGHVAAMALAAAILLALGVRAFRWS